MLALGKPQSADKQFRLAGQDRDLPPDIAKMIRGARAVIRQQRAWHFDVDFGIAPDSNINNATAVDQVTVNLGGYSLPLTLDPGRQGPLGHRRERDRLGRRPPADLAHHLAARRPRRERDQLRRHRL